MTYNRATAKKRWNTDTITDFIGWDGLQRLLDSIEKRKFQRIYEKAPRYIDLKESRALLATLFETGVRTVEGIGGGKFDHIPGLYTDDFAITTDRVSVTIRVAKRYTKVDRVKKWRLTERMRMHRCWVELPDVDFLTKHDYEIEEYTGWVTEPKLVSHKVNFPVIEPLTKIVVDWVKKKREEGPKVKLFDLTHRQFYTIITEAGRKIGEDFPPHRLRAERATQMVQEYDYREHELLEWFLWLDEKMAHKYARLGRKVPEKMMTGAKKLFGGHEEITGLSKREEVKTDDK